MLQVAFCSFRYMRISVKYVLYKVRLYSSGYLYHKTLLSFCKHITQDLPADYQNLIKG